METERSGGVPYCLADEGEGVGRRLGAAAPVIARPPRIFLAFLAAGAALEAVWPLPVLSGVVRFGLGPVLMASGVALMAAAMGCFRRAGTPVPTCEATRTLVTDGVYRFSRNPIYVAGLLLYLGVAVAAGSGWLLGLFVPFAGVIHFGVVRREERYLETRFGDAYRDYRRTTRRWV